MCAKSHIHQSCGRLPKKLFSAKGYAEIHIQRPVFDNKKGIDANIIFKIRTVETWSLGSLICKKFPHNKIPISQFLVLFLSFTCLLWKFCGWAVRNLDKRMGNGCHVD
jgi:hypothetical protein